MLAKRIIPCLDINKERVVKGINFKNLKDIGNPLELARYYSNSGADEISFLDITASYENRKIILEFVKSVAMEVFIPLSVGGGIRTIEEIQSILAAGAEKVSIGTSAVQNPQLIAKAANKFGKQAIVLSIDVQRSSSMKNGWEVYINGGRKPTGLDALEFAQKIENLGSGEILLNSIDRDGTKLGYDLELIKLFNENLKIPIIASGGAGTLENILDAFTIGGADAALVASLFHYKNYKIQEVKKYLRKHKVEVRL